MTEEERREVRARLKEDRTALADEYDIKYVFAALQDWKIYVHMLITIGMYLTLTRLPTLKISVGIYTPLYSISLFLPTIVKNMGYTNNQSQLMSVPPYVLGCLTTITAGYLADRSKKRGPYMIFFCIVAIAGFILLISTHNPPVQYVGTFLAVSGFVCSPFIS